MIKGFYFIGMRMENIAGKKFGRLLVKGFSHKDSKGTPKYLCECECKELREVSIYHLKSGHTKSCGCLTRENIIKRSTKHGLSKTRLQVTYSNILMRCTNTKNPSYKRYGGRGIKVSPDWLGENGLKNFSSWAQRNGYKDNLTLDRIDNNGGYYPENCRWVTTEVQARNKGIRKSNKSGYSGISMYPKRKTWRVLVGKVQIGTFKTLKEAVESRNRYIENNSLTGYVLQEYKEC